MAVFGRDTVGNKRSWEAAMTAAGEIYRCCCRCRVAQSKAIKATQCLYNSTVDGDVDLLMTAIGYIYSKVQVRVELNLYCFEKIDY